MANSVRARRRFLKSVAALGVGSATFQRALAAQVEPNRPVTAELVQQAEWISGLTLTDDERKEILQELNQQQRGFAAMRAVPIANSTPPALHFDPAPWLPPAPAELRMPAQPAPTPTPAKPATSDDLAFLPLTSLAALLRGRQVSSVGLHAAALA
mgnify:FL=1